MTTMTPIILAFVIICSTAPTPTGKPFPGDYTWDPACLKHAPTTNIDGTTNTGACPGVTKNIADYVAQNKKAPLSYDDRVDLGKMIQWHTRNCNGLG
jgi:hypothetical protein